jgi:hypothetical protein
VWLASNGYLSTLLYKQTVIHRGTNKNKQITSFTWKILLQCLTATISGDYTISVILLEREKKTNVSLLLLCLLKFSSRISNWTRTMHSIKQHGTHCSSPIKYIAHQLWWQQQQQLSVFVLRSDLIKKKAEGNRVSSPCNRLDEEQLAVVVSIFKCCSKNVYDEEHHHHQEARSMSYSSSLVSMLTITFTHLASHRKENEEIFQL